MTIYNTSCCKTSTVPLVVLLYANGASVIPKVAADVGVVTLTEELVFDSDNVVNVVHLGDIDLAVVDKFL